MINQRRMNIQHYMLAHHIFHDISVDIYKRVRGERNNQH